MPLPRMLSVLPCIMSTLTASHVLPVSDGLAVFFARRDRSSADRTPPRSSSRLAPSQTLSLLSVPSVLSLTVALPLSHTLTLAGLSVVTLILAVVTALSFLTVILVILVVTGLSLSVVTLILLVVTGLAVETVVLVVITIAVRPTGSTCQSARSLQSLRGVAPPLKDPGPLCLQVWHDKM